MKRPRTSHRWHSRSRSPRKLAGENVDLAGPFDRWRWLVERERRSRVGVAHRRELTADETVQNDFEIGSFLLVDDAVLKVSSQPVVNGANRPVVECILVASDPLMKQSRLVRSDDAVRQ